MWEIRWLNKERTVGEVWRVQDCKPLPKAPCREGTIRIERTPEGGE